MLNKKISLSFLWTLFFLNINASDAQTSMIHLCTSHLINDHTKTIFLEMDNKTTWSMSKDDFLALTIEINKNADQNSVNLSNLENNRQEENPYYYVSFSDDNNFYCIPRSILADCKHKLLEKLSFTTKFKESNKFNRKKSGHCIIKKISPCELTCFARYFYYRTSNAKKKEIYPLDFNEIENAQRNTLYVNIKNNKQQQVKYVDHLFGDAPLDYFCKLFIPVVTQYKIITSTTKKNIFIKEFKGTLSTKINKQNSKPIYTVDLENNIFFEIILSPEDQKLIEESKEEELSLSFQDKYRAPIIVTVKLCKNTSSFVENSTSSFWPYCALLGISVAALAAFLIYSGKISHLIQQYL